MQELLQNSVKAVDAVLETYERYPYLYDEVIHYEEKTKKKAAPLDTVSLKARKEFTTYFQTMDEFNARVRGLREEANKLIQLVCRSLIALPRLLGCYHVIAQEEKKEELKRF